MAITISGENNNDRIVAADGVIDSISGFNISGIITATSFTGDLTGDVTGNLTGNVTGNINNSTLLLQTGGTERARITSGGQVRIANTTETVSAGADDLVVGTTSGERGITILSGTSSNGNIYFGDTDTAGVENRMGSIRYVHNGNYMRFSTNGNNERLRITSGGSVNIGGNFTQTTYTTQITSGNVNKKIGFGAAAHNDLSNEGSGIFFSRQSDGADGLSGIFAHTNSSLGIAARTDITLHAGGSSTYGAAPERVRITSSGRVSIGVNHSSVQSLLNVKGNNDDGNQTVLLRLGNDSSGSGTGAAICMGAGAGASSQGATIAGFYDGTGTAFTVGTNASFNGSTTERLRITSGGTVNIGGDYTSTTSRLRISSFSYPETTEYLAVFKAGVANGNRFKNRYIKIRNNYTGSAHGGVPIVWEANADGSNNKAYGAVVTESDGDIRFLNAAATSEKAIGTDLLSTISEKFRINTDGTSLFTGNEIKLYNATNNSNTYFYAQNTGAGNAGVRMKNGSGEWTIIANDSLRFRDEDGNTDRLNITSNGDVGIGTVTPTNSTGYKTLSIKGGIGGQIELSGDSVKNYIWTTTSAMNVAAGYIGGSGYQLKVYTDGGGTSTERVRIEDGIVSILDDTNAYYKPELRIKNTYHGGYGGAIIFTGEESNGTEYTQARIRTYGGNGAGDGTLAIEAGDLNEVAQFKSGKMSIGGLTANISGAKGIEISNAATTEIRLKNTNSGTGQADGFGIQKWSDNTVYLYDYDQSDMVFGVSQSSKLKIHKEGRFTLSPSGNHTAGNSQFAVSIVQAGNYAYNGSGTSNYPGIHIKSTSSGGGNGAAIFAPDGNWSLVSSNPGNKTGLAMSPSSTGASSAQTRLFLMEDGQCILGANTFARVNQARFNAAQLTVAGGGINVVPITSGTTSPQVRHTVSWYHAGPNSSYSYQHLVTDVWGGANPTGNTEYIMGGFTIKGYRYSPGGCSNEDIFFHNWGGSMHGYSRSHRGTWDPGNAAYIHSTGYVALRLLTGTYQVYDIDLYQFAVYSTRDFNVTTVTYSNNTTE